MKTKPFFSALLNKRRCSICEICALKCPGGALKMAKDGSFEELLFFPDLCDRCRGEPICAQKCPEEAISIVPGQGGEDTTAVILIRGRLAKCPDCGTSFSPEKKAARVGKRGGKGAGRVRPLCPECRRLHLLDDIPLLREGRRGC